MSSFARRHDQDESVPLPTTRAGLIRFLAALTGDLRADHYLVARLGTERGNDEIRIIAASWTFDTVEALGPETLQRISNAPSTAYVGAAPRVWHPRALDALKPEQADHLAEAGHREVVSVRLRIGSRHYLVLFSAVRPAQLATESLQPALMSLSYALSTVGGEIDDETADYPISERERECLGWVAEGKTTMDIATILGVSSNTINSYLAHVIQKLSARNRAMAVALAIRSGII
ncbi:MAG: helix-turn-helix domain-containing protein [Rhizobiaceae bacterium]|nr:helix-turn-helix domain-containing protein [Rhizobiaceae bacterium]